jgi:hypothetical protein
MHPYGVQAFRNYLQKLYLLTYDINKIKIMIMKTNASVQPRTMMIKSLHALIAFHAMPASPRFYDFTIRTKRSAIENFQQIHELNTFVFNITRILKSNNGIRKKHKGAY